MLPGAQRMRTTLFYTITGITKVNKYRAVASQADSPACFDGTVTRPPNLLQASGFFQPDNQGLRLLIIDSVNAIRLCYHRFMFQPVQNTI